MHASPSMKYGAVLLLSLFVCNLHAVVVGPPETIPVGGAETTSLDPELTTSTETMQTSPASTTTTSSWTSQRLPCFENAIKGSHNLEGSIPTEPGVDVPTEKQDFLKDTVTFTRWFVRGKLFLSYWLFPTVSGVQLISGGYGLDIGYEQERKELKMGKTDGKTHLLTGSLAVGGFLNGNELINPNCTGGALLDVLAELKLSYKQNMPISLSVFGPKGKLAEKLFDMKLRIDAEVSLTGTIGIQCWIDIDQETSINDPQSFGVCANEDAIKRVEGVLAGSIVVTLSAGRIGIEVVGTGTISASLGLKKPWRWWDQFTIGGSVGVFASALWGWVWVEGRGHVSYVKPREGEGAGDMGFECACSFCDDDDDGCGSSRLRRKRQILPVEEMQSLPTRHFELNSAESARAGASVSTRVPNTPQQPHMPNGLDVATSASSMLSLGVYAPISQSQSLDAEACLLAVRLSDASAWLQPVELQDAPDRACLHPTVIEVPNVADTFIVAFASMTWGPPSGSTPQYELKSVTVRVDSVSGTIEYVQAADVIPGTDVMQSVTEPFIEHLPQLSWAQGPTLLCTWVSLRYFGSVPGDSMSVTGRSVLVTEASIDSSGAVTWLLLTPITLVPNVVGNYINPVIAGAGVDGKSALLMYQESVNGTEAIYGRLHMIPRDSQGFWNVNRKQIVHTFASTGSEAIAVRYARGHFHIVYAELARIYTHLLSRQEVGGSNSLSGSLTSSLQIFLSTTHVPSTYNCSTFDCATLIAMPSWLDILDLGHSLVMVYEVSAHSGTVVLLYDTMANRWQESTRDILQHDYVGFRVGWTAHHRCASASAASAMGALDAVCSFTYVSPPSLSTLNVDAHVRGVRHEFRSDLSLVDCEATERTASCTLRNIGKAASSVTTVEWVLLTENDTAQHSLLAPVLAPGASHQIDWFGGLQATAGPFAIFARVDDATDGAGVRTVTLDYGYSVSLNVNLRGGTGKRRRKRAVDEEASVDVRLKVDDDTSTLLQSLPSNVLQWPFSLRLGGFCTFYKCVTIDTYRLKVGDVASTSGITVNLGMLSEEWLERFSVGTDGFGRGASMYGAALNSPYRFTAADFPPPIEENPDVTTFGGEKAATTTVASDASATTESDSSAFSSQSETTESPMNSKEESANLLIPIVIGGAVVLLLLLALVVVIFCLLFKRSSSSSTLEARDTGIHAPRGSRRQSRLQHSGALRHSQQRRASRRYRSSMHFNATTMDELRVPRRGGLATSLSNY